MFSHVIIELINLFEKNFSMTINKYVFPIFSSSHFRFNIFNIWTPSPCISWNIVYFIIGHIDIITSKHIFFSTEPNNVRWVEAKTRFRRQSIIFKNFNIGTKFNYKQCLFCEDPDLYEYWTRIWIGDLDQTLLLDFVIL